MSVAFSPDGKTLAAGYSLGPSTGGGVLLWDVAGRKRVVEKSLPVTEGSVTSLAFSPDGKTLAAGYGYAHRLYTDGGVVLWDVAGRKRVIQASLPVKGGPGGGRVASVAFSPDSKTLAAGYVCGSGASVALWDVAGRKRVVEESLPVTDGSVTGVAFSPCGNILAAGYARNFDPPGGGVVLWDVVGRKRVVQASLPGV